ncbi:hypothetical protein PRIC2_006472 [Phytophthora ramorum]
MEGLGVVYEQEEPAADAVSNQHTPAGDNQPAAATHEAEDDGEIRALAGNPDDLDAHQPQQQQLPVQAQQHQQQPQHLEGYADYGQSSGQHPQQQMEHHGGGPRDGPQPGKLFIGGVSWETTEDTLRQHFGKYGELTDAALMKDKYTGQPRGFGFVTFADASAIDRVLDETHTLDGRSVEVKRAIPRERTAPGSSDFRGGRGGFGGGGGGGGGGYTEQKKIFVGGLAPTVTEQDFRHYFEEYGKITDAVVMIDRDTQRSRGFGFITFEDEASVAEVISKSHEIHGKVVEIKRAEPKEARAGGGAGGGGGGGYGYAMEVATEEAMVAAMVVLATVLLATVLLATVLPRTEDTLSRMLAMAMGATGVMVVAAATVDMEATAATVLVARVPVLVPAVKAVQVGKKEDTARKLLVKEELVRAARHLLGATATVAATAREVVLAVLKEALVDDRTDTHCLSASG